MDLSVISGSQFPKIVIPLIESAKNSIDIIVFDWRWYPQDPGAICQLFNQAILRASKRKVKIRAIVNNNYIVNLLNNNGVLAKKLLTARLVHSKLMIIDNQIVITGSHNYTQSAFQMNLELSVVLSDVVDVSAFSSFFDNLWNI